MKMWEPDIGEGVYTTSDVVMFNIEPSKVNRWLNNYWRTDRSHQPYLLDNKCKVFGFHVFIELYTIAKLRECGVSFQRIYDARKILVEEFQADFPFALGNLLCDGHSILLKINKKTLMNLNGHGQYELTDILKNFCKKIDFGKQSNLAERYWPMGKNASVVIDPKIAFGQPCIAGSGIQAETIYNLYKAGEKKNMLLDAYRINEKQYKDSILFAEKYKKAA
jgi:uncharacterized protein (DUF433 family)